jgi:hypothetical protein
MLLDAYCVPFRNYMRDDVSKFVATLDSSSDEWMMSPCSSLLGATVAMGRLSMTTMTYDSLLQCIFVVVNVKYLPET